MKETKVSLLELFKFNNLRHKSIVFWRWMTANNIRRLVAVVLLISVVCLVVALIVNRQQPVTPNSPIFSDAKKSIDISSEPAGISMQGPVECAETFTTPFTCHVPKASGAYLSFNAPASAEVGGKKMTFLTWEGCSVSNEDKKICEVDLNTGESSPIKAVYSVVTDASSDSNKLNTPGPDKPPLSECSNTPDATRVVTCSTTVYKTPFAYLFKVEYPRDDQGNYYYAPVAHNPYISCTNASVCEPINALPNTVLGIVSGINKPGKFFIRLLSEAKTSNGKKILFDKWEVKYDPDRFPLSDPNQHVVYFVTAYYVIAADGQ